MLNDVKKVILTEEQLEKRVEEIACSINKDYEGKKPFFIVILKGGMVFAAEIFKRITLYAEIDFMVVSSYCGGMETTGTVNIIKDVKTSIEGKDVIIVEDIVDTGITMDCLIKELEKRNPASIEVCACVNKPSRRLVDVDVKYLGFDIENEFIVGYGLDYNEEYRNLPFIGVLKEEKYL